MTDLLTARIASAKGRARVRVSATERDAVRTTRAAREAALQGAIERERIANHKVTVDRMQSLLTERGYVVETLNREREAGRNWHPANNPTLEHLAKIDAELSIVFGTPILASDAAPGGRFARNVAYHMRRIASRHTIGSMLITGDDASDIVMLAVVRAYTDGLTTEDSRGQTVPTLGAMYRLCRAELVRAVSRARREVASVSRDADVNERESIPRNGAASLFGVDPARIDWEDRDTVRSILTPAPRWAVTPDAADIALAERIAKRRAAFERAEAQRIARERSGDRAEAAEVATFGGDDTLGIDAACVALLASGSETLDSLAARLGIKPETVARRLASVRIATRAGKHYAAYRVGSDGRSRRIVSVQGRDTSVRIVPTRKRAERVARVIPWDAVPEGMRNATTPVPMPHMADELEAALESGDERIIALTESVREATASLRLTDSGARFTPPAAPPAMTADDRHRAAHRMSRCNCDAA